VMCQHCSHAPCEGVCPVLATYHNLDGLNTMIYNRCVGTRYCANNCPYSARRFNFHTFGWPESFNLMLNPDVLVREMGVMEKCTFCVQNIRSFKDDWRDQAGFAGQGVAPKESDSPEMASAYQRIAACAAVCPTNAITFGNFKDEASAVHKKFNDERSYTLLGELNNKPGVRYLARVVHTDVELHHGGGHHDDHGAGHGDDSHGDHSHDKGHDAGHKKNNHKEKEHH
jgi:Fe-S-cluster-containing dehydrogenase component